MNCLLKGLNNLSMHRTHGTNIIKRITCPIVHIKPIEPINIYQQPVPIEIVFRKKIEENSSYNINCCGNYCSTCVANMVQ
jgi:hypothetical protein